MKILFYLSAVVWFSSQAIAAQRPLWLATEALRNPKNKEIHRFRLSQLPNGLPETQVEKRCLLTRPARIYPELNGAQNHFLVLTIHLEGQDRELHLVRSVSLEKGTRILFGSGKETDWKPGLYYQGVLADDPGSLVAISIFETDFIGVISSRIFGDWNLTQEKKGTRIHVEPAAKSSPMACGTPENKHLPEIDLSSINRQVTTVTTKKVRIYYEVDFDIFQSKGGTASTLNWLSALHHTAKTLFFNDGIQIVWNDTKIWDSYRGFSIFSVYAFANSNPSFRGDVGVYLNLSGETSAAMGIGNVCSTQHTNGNGFGPYCLTILNGSSDSLQQVILQVSTLCHEIGHVLGSRHTHDCVWNGDNTQIDDCGNISFELPGSHPCYDPQNPILPPGNLGTIMGYCAQNLTNGFGEQPAELIRQRINGFPCIPDTGETCCFPSIDSLKRVRSTSVRADFRIVDSDTSHNQWAFRLLDNNLVPIRDWDTTFTPEFSIRNLAPGSGFMVQVKALCPYPLTSSLHFMEFGSTYSTLCNQIFDDGDGQVTQYTPENANYFLFPDAEEKKVRLDFYFCSLFNGDTVSVYNGIGTNGTLLGRKIGNDPSPWPLLLSTDTTGGLTVSLRTNLSFSGFGTGWMALVTCNSPVHVQGSWSDKPLSLSPNPATDYLELFGSHTEEISIFNLYGQQVQKPKMLDHKEDRSIFSISYLPPGAYWVKASDWLTPIRFIKN